LLSSGVLLQHDNAWLHTAHATANKITDLCFECPPQPAYSLDLALSDFGVWTPQGDTLWQEVLHGWGERGGAQLVTQSVRFFFPWNPGISEMLGHLHWTWWELGWKVMFLIWLCIFS
jgi:hypothetical protein